MLDLKKKFQSHFKNINILFTECPAGVPVAMCSNNPCDGKTCLANKAAICRPSYCGGCYAKFYDSHGHKVECEKG